MEMKVEAQDVINFLTEQRNAALNEVAMLKAQVSALQRQLKEVQEKPVEVSED
jgi:hypothetical protein